MKNKIPETENSLDAMMQRLEQITKALSEDSDTLESTLQSYEEGIELAKECLKRLDAAEQHVTRLRSVLESDSIDPDPLSGSNFPID